MTRAVVDANVLISALIRPEGPPGEVVRALARERFEIVLSPSIADELGRALRYPKVRKHISLSDEELEVWVAALLVLAVHVRPVVEVQAVEADPADDVYLAAALEATAAYVVTGDKHLLKLERYEDVQIVTPRAFIAMLDQ